jgi:hypothetical protein
MPAVNVFRYVDSDSARKHRDSQQSNFIAELLGGYRLRRRNRVVLGFGHRQINIDRLHFAVEFFNEKIRGFADGERQVVWGQNFSSTAFKQQISRTYTGRKGWPP